MQEQEDRILVNCRFIGEFDQLDVLGEGTYGTVYRAKDKRTNEEVAIKKMKVHDTQCKPLLILQKDSLSRRSGRLKS